jgi:hypothetical protein
LALVAGTSTVTDLPGLSTCSPKDSGHTVGALDTASCG